MTDDKTPDAPDQPEADGQEEPEPRRGRMRFQDETTTPREPTLAEQRARRKALEREAEQEAAHTEVERKTRTRRRVLIGSGVTVGVVALVAVWYNAASPSEVTARCVGDNDVVADSAICDDPNYVTSHGGYYSGGFWFVPIPGGGVNRYHYYYGGSVDAGGRVSGGSVTAPSSRTTVKSSSGKTVQRGGFGISGGSKSGGS